MLSAALASALPAMAQAQGRIALRNGDYIVAVVNQELVTAGEIDQRIDRAREGAAKGAPALPPEAELRKQVLESLIEDRVIVTYARESAAKIEEPELDRAVQNVAAQNQLSLPQLRDRLKAEGVDYVRFRANLRDQMLVERVREREVYQRIRITDGDIDKLVDRQRAEAQADAELNIAQVLVTVPEAADAATLAARRQRAEAALSRILAGEAFDKVARDLRGWQQGQGRRDRPARGVAPARSLCRRCAPARCGRGIQDAAAQRCGLSRRQARREARWRRHARDADARAAHPAAHLRAAQW